MKICVVYYASEISTTSPSMELKYNNGRGLLIWSDFFWFIKIENSSWILSVDVESDDYFLTRCATGCL